MEARRICLQATAALLGTVIAPQLGWAQSSEPSSAVDQEGGSSQVMLVSKPRNTFFSLRVRDTVVPKYVTRLFGDGGRTWHLWQIGPELSFRRGRSDIAISATYGSLKFKDALFRNPDDGATGWELVSSKMGSFNFAFDAMYTVPFDDDGKYAFLVGGGAGLGFVFGPLYRSHAYPDNPAKPDGTDASKWSACKKASYAPFDPSTGESYCVRKQDRLAGYKEPSWADGGSKPTVLPWVSLPQFSIRLTPVQRFMLRFDVGFSLYGPFFGGAMGVGF